MNKINKGLALSALTLAAAFASAQNGISVSVDGRPVNFVGTAPRSVNGRILVPLRGVFEQMGAFVQWNADQQEIVATRGNSDVRLHIGSRTATIDGREVTLDVPPMESNGATLVPIRFLSESLGAEVKWREAQRQVIIISDQGRAQHLNDQDYRPDQNRNGGYRPGTQQEIRIADRTFARNTIIPVTLDTPLSSDQSQRGDTFTATVRTDSGNNYGYLPRGSQIEGHVISARAQNGEEPGLLELSFDRVRMPDGSDYPIAARLINLDNADVTRNHGMLMANGKSAQDNRTVYAGYGAGAGLVVGLLTKKPLEGTIIGGILGYLGGQQQQNQNRPRNVRLDAGQEFGVRLTRELAVMQRG